MYARSVLVSIAIGIMAAGSAAAAEPQVRCKTTKQPDRCIAMLSPIIVEDIRIAADHGPGYDDRGNPLDRHGNVIAVQDRSGGAREVFTSDQWRR